MCRPPRDCLWLLLAALLLAPAAGRAATISSVTIVKNAGNSADFFDNSGTDLQRRTEHGGRQLELVERVRDPLRCVVSADRDGGGSGSTTQGLTGDFTISFSVTETAGTAWDVTLDVLRAGAQTIVSDSGGYATVAFGALIGGQTGAGSITSGSLNLAALTTLSNQSAEATSPNSPFSQTTSAILSGIGTGFAQSVNLNFAFTATAATSVDPSGGNVKGDEAALRMGLDSALSQFTADDYPGTDGRVILGDGIFLSASLKRSPEPGTATLLGLGVGVLAYLRRRA